VLDLVVFFCSGLMESLGALDGFEQPVEFEWLGEVIEGAALRGSHDGVHGSATGHQDDSAIRIVASCCFEHVEAGAVV
jgi:hypothetical protein